MDTIQYFLSNITKLVVILLIIIGVFMLFQKFAPDFMKKYSLGRLGSSFFTDNWLPDPVNMQDVAKPKTADLSANIYEGGMTPGTSYAIYTENGMQIVHVPPKPGMGNSNAITTYTDNSLFVRSLTLYSGESVGTNKVFSGEARSTFFKNGTFPIYIVDKDGRIFAAETAISTGQWTVPGWVRFNVQIHSVLPRQQACQLLFVPDPLSTDGRSSFRAQVPVVCN